MSIYYVCVYILCVSIMYMYMDIYIYYIHVYVCIFWSACGLTTVFALLSDFLSMLAMKWETVQVCVVLTALTTVTALKLAERTSPSMHLSYCLYLWQYYDLLGLFEGGLFLCLFVLIREITYWFSSFEVFRASHSGKHRKESQGRKRATFSISSRTHWQAPSPAGMALLLRLDS